MKTHLSRTVGAAALLASLILPATVLAKDKIVIGEQNWTGAIAIQNILAEVIKTRLDGDVSYLAGDVAVLLSAAAKGDGSVDVLTDIWLPNQSAAWNKYVTGAPVHWCQTSSLMRANKGSISPGICRTNTALNPSTT